MDFNSFIPGIISAIIAFLIIQLAIKFFGFKVKGWVIPIVFFIGFVANPHLTDLFASNENEVITNKTFTNVTLEIDGKSYYDCKFHNCKLVYKAERPFSFKSNVFSGATYFSFDGKANNTLVAIRTIFNFGDDASKYEVLKIFSDISEPDKVLIVTEKQDTLSMEWLSKNPILNPTHN